MLPVLHIVVIAYFVLYALAYSIPYHFAPTQAFLREDLHLEKPEFGPQSSLEAWIREEENIALDRLLRNIAPGGSNTEDAVPGTVIASPSKTHPDYYYQCEQPLVKPLHPTQVLTASGIRDAAITMRTLVDLYASDPTSYLSTKLVPLLEAYAAQSHALQHEPNPSGTFSDLSGLGEPKFLVSGHAFTGSWGRPQRDGPALRALTLAAYLRAYNATHPLQWHRAASGAAPNPFADLYAPELPARSVIKADLEYVGRVWRDPGFDLWEEVRGLHFFTAMVQRRALRDGAALAAAFGDGGAARWYAGQAVALDAFVQRFWDDAKGHLVATLESSRSGLDCGVLLGAIHGTADDAVDDMFAPWSDEVLVSLLALVRDQRQRFPINAVPSAPVTEDGKFDQLAGVGIGRYPEDQYDGYGVSPAGGNPWFLCTASVSEILYRSASHITATKILNVTSTGLPFWSALLQNDDLSEGTLYRSGDEEYAKALQRLESVGDAFLAVVRKHTDGEGALSEQFDRVTGYERGALDLTWSYGAFLQAVKARKTLKADDQ